MVVSKSSLAMLLLSMAVAIAIAIARSDPGKLTNGTYARCQDLPKDVNAQHPDLLEKYSLQFYIVLSNKPATESCLVVGYSTLTTTPNGAVVGTAIMGNPMLAPNGIRANVSITSLPDQTGWNVVGGIPNSVNFIVAYFNIDVPYLCAYTCNETDSDDIYVDNLRCIVASDAGFAKMKEDVWDEFKLWPFRAGEEPQLVYTQSCRNTGMTSTSN